MPDSAPLIQRFATRVASTIAAGTQTTTVCKAPFAGTVSLASYIPDGAITGATATKRTLTLQNKGQSGAGTTAVAILDFVTGTNGVAQDEGSMTLQTAANLVVAAGDVIALVETVTSTGTVNPGGLVNVEITRS